jgi:Fe-S-cluster-containing hydrogenase component 2
VSACPLGNISFSPATRKVFKCELCGGEPKCAKYCPSGAILYVEPTDSPERKKAVANHFKEIFGEEAVS